MPTIINDKLHEELNELARELYAAMGYEVKEGFDFTLSRHPQEWLAYRLAEISYDFWLERLEEDV